MPRMDVRAAMEEYEEAKGDLCRSCSAPAEEAWEPYCMHCGSYWRDVDEGVFDEDEGEC